MKNQIIKVGNKSFTLHSKKTVPHTRIPFKSLSDCYARPSDTKMRIYNDWLVWSKKNNGHMSITGYNCNFFSLAGYITIDNIKYLWTATASNNDLYRVVD